MKTLLIRDQDVPFTFRTTLTDRVGTLRDKGQYSLTVTWRDGRGPKYVHRNFRAEPWPREKP